MDAGTVATFFGVLLLGGLALATAAISRPRTRAALRENALQIAAIVAAGATAGSLYFSEFAGFVPCELCWFQRIAMYPLALILPIAAIRRDRSAVLYGLALAVIGGAISGYHTQLQLFPDQSSFCEVTNPCSGHWVEAFGWMTIPQMAGISFALVIALLSLVLTSPVHEEHS